MSTSQAVDISIMGREFTIACKDDEREGLLSAVSYLNKKMEEINNSGKVPGLDNIAMMAALNISHELLNAQSGGVDIGGIKRRISAMQDQIDVEIKNASNLF